MKLVEPAKTIEIIKENNFAFQKKYGQNFLIDTFTVDEIIGKTIIIHNKADDFETDPSGDSGTKIACGEIK